VNGEKVVSQEAFYTRLWQGTVDQEVRLRFEAITVRPSDRYRVYRTSDK